jgi:hypothetical protein
MTTNAIPTQGTLFKRGDGGSPEVFTTIGEVTGFDGLAGGKASVIDATHLQSAFKEKLMGLPDEGQVSLTLNFVPSDAQQIAMRADRAARTKRNFRVVFTDSGNETANFSGFVLTFPISAKPDSKVDLGVTIEITGPISWS